MKYAAEEESSVCYYRRKRPFTLPEGRQPRQCAAHRGMAVNQRKALLLQQPAKLKIRRGIFPEAKRRTAYRQRMPHNSPAAVYFFRLRIQLREIRRVMNFVMITVNEEDYRRALHFPLREGGRTVRIPGVGLSLEKFADPGRRRAQLRAAYGIPEGCFYLLTAGELNRNKNQQVSKPSRMEGKTNASAAAQSSCRSLR